MWRTLILISATFSGLTSVGDALITSNTFVRENEFDDKIDSTNIIKLTNNTSVARCATSCDRDTNCVAFYVNPQTKICQEHSLLSVTGMPGLSNSPGFRYYRNNNAAPSTTTAPSTTAPFTTEAPTTAPPTTEAPTTAPPTTEAPTTAPPSTAAPTTAPPTTEAPTTAPPTTVAPTTAPPTTEAPTTAPPTTVAPTTAPPTTEAPTTAPPTTEAPTTAPPTTVAPTTAPPTTAAPSTAPPTTEAPTTAPPTTVAPTTAPPTTAAPSTAPPTTAPGPFVCPQHNGPWSGGLLPDGFIYHYLIINDRQERFDRATELCAENGGTLPKIYNKEKMDFYLENIVPCPDINGFKFWIDGTNINAPVKDDPNAYTTSDGIVIPINLDLWAPDRPNTPSSQNCIQSRPETFYYYFDDYDCDRTEHEVLCEKKIT